MTVLTAADYADTGQWRLTVRIYQNGISAYLDNTLHADVDSQLLFSSDWEEDPSNLLRHIENAVYDHPRVLDDFSARIIIFDRKTLFVPSAAIENNEGAEESLFCSVYDSEPNDILTDIDKDITAIFSPAPGLKAFLLRTFPGARIECNLMREIAIKRESNSGITLFISQREKECDFVFLNGNNLLSAATRICNSQNDIAYHAFNLFNVYGVNPKETEICCEGFSPEGEFLNSINSHTREVNR